MKKLFIFFTLVLSVFLFVGCKPDHEEGENDILMFYPGMSDENGDLLPAYKIAAEKANVNLIPQVGYTTEYTQLDNLIATKQYPDMINVQESTDLRTYIMYEFLQPIDVLIEEYAPNIQKYLDDYPAFKAQITWSDGHIYHLPSINTDMPTVQKAITVREDWLNQYRTAASKAADWEPSTPKEMTSMFAWWVANITPKDMQGNTLTGEKVIPYFDRKGGRPEQAFNNILCLLGSQYTFFYDENGDIKFAGETPEFKAALTEMAIWWENNYVDPNFFDRSASGAARDNYWTNTNKGGLTMDYITGTFTFLENSASLYEGFDLATMDPMGGFLSTTDGALFVKGGQAITRTAKNPEACMRLLNYLWSEEGQLLTSYGIEGQTFEYVDGEPKLLPGWTKDTLREIGVRNPDMTMVFSIDIEYEDGMPEVAREALVYNNKFTRYITDGEFFRTQANTYLEDTESTLYQTNFTNIRGAVDQYIQNVMMGNKNLTSDYDTFIAEVKALRLDETLELAQKAFDKLVDTYNLDF
ncbi:MAG: hypothetical protein PHX62_04530 [Bacilli bacterium]|nr:hypothetical protein [Bacilli bacterium]